MLISLRCRCIFNGFILFVLELYVYYIVYFVLEKSLGVFDEEIIWRVGFNGIWNIGNYNIIIGI